MANIRELVIYKPNNNGDLFTLRMDDGFYMNLEYLQMWKDNSYIDERHSGNFFYNGTEIGTISVLKNGIDAIMISEESEKRVKRYLSDVLADGKVLSFVRENLKEGEYISSTIIDIIGMILNRETNYELKKYIITPPTNSYKIIFQP